MQLTADLTRDQKDMVAALGIFLGGLAILLYLRAIGVLL